MKRNNNNIEYSTISADQAKGIARFHLIQFRLTKWISCVRVAATPHSSRTLTTTYLVEHQISFVEITINSKSEAKIEQLSRFIANIIHYSHTVMRVICAVCTRDRRRRSQNSSYTWWEWNQNTNKGENPRISSAHWQLNRYFDLLWTMEFSSALVLIVKWTS